MELTTITVTTRESGHLRAGCSSYGEMVLDLARVPSRTPPGFEGSISQGHRQFMETGTGLVRMNVLLISIVHVYCLILNRRLEAMALRSQMASRLLLLYRFNDLSRFLPYGSYLKP